MALIRCPDCGSECSNMAPACPRCGRPLGGQKSAMTKDLGLGGFIYSLLIIVGVILAIKVQHIAPLLVFSFPGVILLLARLRIWSGVERK